MPSRPPVDLPGVFTSLAEIARGASTPKDMYAAICVAATMTIPGCDHASLMIRHNGVFSTAAVSDDIARQIDRLELALGSGPCLDAIEERTAQIETNLTANSKWPALTSRVLAHTPVRGALSVQLPVDRARIGALNLFSDTPGAFDEQSMERALVLGAFATVSTTAAAQGEDAASLRRGLASSREIGKAIGMLMVLNDVSDDDAFGLLRRTSQTTNVKLADIAADVVRTRARPAV
jgi:transcriptional regulator with GAF, ATPase, and Fis domain